MSLFSDIFNWFSAIFKKLLSAVTDFLKKYWVIIALVAIIWFAPAIATWLTSSGAPSWLSGTFSWIGSTITPIVTSAGTALWDGVTSFASGAWAAFTDAGFGTQLAVIGLAGMLLAPEETAKVISDVGEAAGELIGSVAGAAITAVTSSPLIWIAVAAAGAYLLFSGDDSSDKDVAQSAQRPQPVGRSSYVYS